MNDGFVAPQYYNPKKVLSYVMCKSLFVSNVIKVQPQRREARGEVLILCVFVSLLVGVTSHSQPKQNKYANGLLIYSIYTCFKQKSDTTSCCLTNKEPCIIFYFISKYNSLKNILSVCLLQQPDMFMRYLLSDLEWRTICAISGLLGGLGSFLQRKPTPRYNLQLWPL